ncbi:hypothetical protein GCM10023205_12660 [Yinghuangia aomiensis]|uniref:Uncharacterized protein n=1 Tax=Yinghuangia aomiensis TaxID=676205 RepID=A0ABP9GT99_9ACTN
MTANLAPSATPYTVVPTGSAAASAGRHLAWLLAEWRRRSIACGWPQPEEWLTPGAEAAVAAFFRPGRIRAACHDLARDRAEAGVPLAAALSDLDLLFLTAVGRGASDSVVAAYVAARHAHLPVAEGFDPLTELPSGAALRADVLRRRSAAGGEPPTVVAIEPQIGAYPTHERLRPTLLVAAHVEEIFGAPVHLLDDGRLAVVAPPRGTLGPLMALAGLAPRDPVAAVTGSAAVPALRPSVVGVEPAVAGGSTRRGGLRVA